MARFSLFDKEEIVNDLLAVNASVHRPRHYSCEASQATEARIQRFIQLCTNSPSEQYDVGPSSEKKWPVLHAANIALAQAAPPLDFSDFVDLIRRGFPNQAPALERRRAAILALAFGHLGLCKTLLDNEEVPLSQRVPRLFQLRLNLCSFHCLRMVDFFGIRPPLQRLRDDQLGRVMEAVVRGKLDNVRSIFEQESLPLALQRKAEECLCRSRHGLVTSKHPGVSFAQLPVHVNFIVKSPIDAAVVRGETAILKELLLSQPDAYWNSFESKEGMVYSLEFALMRGDLAIFDLLFNVKRPVQLYLRKRALPVIMEYGRSAFLTRFFTMAAPDTDLILSVGLFERCVESAIKHNQGEIIEDLFREVEKCGVDLGLFPIMNCLQNVLAKRSHDLLRSYLLASEKSFSRIPIPRTGIEKIFQPMFMAEWPEGVAFLYDAGVFGEKPLSLTKLCLSTIRRSLRHPVKDSVQLLPLPKAKKKLLLLDFF